MTVRENSVEGVADGTTITTGNSGGGSGTAFTLASLTVAVAAGALVGSRSSRINNPGTSVAFDAYQGAGNAVVSYYTFTLSALTSGHEIFRGAYTADTMAVSVRVNATGRLEVYTKGNILRGTTTNPIVAGQTYRLTLMQVGGSSSTTGQVQVALYDGTSSTTPLWDSGLITGIDMSTSAAGWNIQGYQIFGKYNGTSYAGTMLMDAFGTRDGADAIWGAYPATISANVYDKTVSDSVAIVDLGSEQTLAFGAALDDAVGLADAATLAAGYDRAVTDAVGATDSMVNLEDLVRPLGDPAGISDAVSTLLARGASQSDPLGITDAAVALLARATVQADAVGATDVVTALLARAAAQADPVGITDTVSITAGRAFAQPESLGITDTVDVAFSSSGAASLGDTEGITDVVTVVSLRNLASSEPVGIADSVGLVVSLARPANDPVGIADSMNAALTSASGVSIVDAAGISDALAVDQSRLLGSADPVGITDSMIASLTSGATALPVDPVGISDSVLVTTARIRAQGDGLGLVDTMIATLSGPRAVGLGDSAAILDTMVAVLETPIQPTTGPVYPDMGYPDLVMDFPPRQLRIFSIRPPTE